MVFLKHRIIGLLISTCIIFAGPISSHSQENMFPLKDLKMTIQEAISDARALSDTEPYFLIKMVELELRGTSSGEGGFSIPVFGSAVNLGLEGDISSSDKLELALIPTQSIVVGGEKKIDLAGLLSELKSAFKRDKENETGFNILSAKYTKIWTLQYNAGGNINFIIAKGDVKISREKQQKIIFTLCETLNHVDCVPERE
jgi:hypothetical protein